MELTAVEHNGIRYISGVKGQKLIRAEPDINDLMSALYEKDADRVLLYKENLPEGFVSLGTGQAGMVLNKFMTYKLKLAVVVDEADVNKGKFAEMVTEVNKYNSLFHVFTEHADAHNWLTQAG